MNEMWLSCMNMDEERECIEFIVQYAFNICNYVIESFRVFQFHGAKDEINGRAPVELQPMCHECRGTVTVKLNADGGSEPRRKFIAHRRK